MLYTTLNELFEIQDGYELSSFKRALLRIFKKKEPDDEPIAFDTILEKIGLNQTFYCFQNIASNQDILFFCHLLMEAMSPHTLNYTQLHYCINKRQENMNLRPPVLEIKIPRRIFNDETLRKCYSDAFAYYLNEDYKELMNSLYAFIFYEKIHTADDKEGVRKLEKEFETDMSKLLLGFFQCYSER